ncbi:Solute carrier family 2, facilitated glucose transporter member 11-like isoform X4 [Aix galericulata]|nr:Solute carrier family 2, facilitated glucose transporter member 11-like isoform X4 [Aix galericulata]
MGACGRRSSCPGLSRAPRDRAAVVRGLQPEPPGRGGPPLEQPNPDQMRSSAGGFSPAPWTLFLAVCAVGIGGTFQYGYNVSIINAPTQHIHRFLNETWISRYHMELSPDLLTFLWSVIASIFSLGGLCGALIGGSMAIRLGRKGALLMNNIIAVLAAILMGISFPTGLFELLIVGRFLIGINSAALFQHLPNFYSCRGFLKVPDIFLLTEIYFYATYIFEQAGISAEKIPYVTLGTGACECLTALTCGLLIDYVGRRYLIIGGYLLMILWSIILTFSLTYQELYSWVPYVSMTSIFAFILSFGLGPGGITNTLTAELFIQSSRPAAYMIGGIISWISFFTIGMLFPFIVKGLKQYCFLVFILECSLVAAFIFLVIPETKNKSFLEIKKEFHKLNFGGKNKEKETELYERRQLHDEF